MWRALGLSMFHRNFKSSFYKWVNESLSKKLPEGIEGFSFNLIENSGDFSVELVGTASFDEDDQDWACDEIFEPNKRSISIPEKYSGLQWESCLDNMQTLLISYMKSNEKGALVLQCAQGIGIGFVDGDLIVVKKP